MKKLILTLFFLVSTITFYGQEHVKTYYKSNKNGKVYTETEYEIYKQKVTDKLKKYDDLLLKEKINATTILKDSIIKHFELGYTVDFKAKAKKEKDFLNNLLNSKFNYSSLNSLSNNNIDFEALKGKPTFVSFWFVACKPCIEEIPLLNTIKKEFSDTVNFIAITFDSEAKLESFLLRTDFNFLHVADAKTFIKSMGINTYPKNMIIDKDGVIKEVYDSILEGSDELKKIKSTLKGFI